MDKQSGGRPPTVIDVIDDESVRAFAAQSSSPDSSAALEEDMMYLAEGKVSTIGTPLRGSIGSSHSTHGRVPTKTGCSGISLTPSNAARNNRTGVVDSDSDQTDPENKKTRGLIKKFVALRRGYILTFTNLSLKLSNFIFDWPWTCMCIFVVLSIGLCSGFFVAVMEEDVYKLYALPKSTAHDHAANISTLFTENRANFLMFNNNLKPGDLLKDTMTMSALWAVDNFVRTRMVVPRVLYDGEDPKRHIWHFLDEEPTDDKGYLRYSDVCALRPDLNRGLGAVPPEREHSLVYSHDWNAETDSLLPSQIDNSDNDDHCDYVSAMGAWKMPRFNKGIRTREFPFYATTWNQRALNLSIVFFGVDTNIIEDPKTGKPIFHEVTDAGGMMMLYYTEPCVEGQHCEGKIWERALIRLQNDLDAERSKLLTSPEAGKEPLVWIDEAGKIVQSGWYDVDKHCSDSRGRIKVDVRRTGSLQCKFPEGEEQPDEGIVINVRNIDLSVYGASSWSDELARSTAFDLQLMSNYVVSFCILVCFGMISMSTRNLYRNKILVGLAGALSGLLGYGGGAGFCYLFGLRHTATMNAVPFLAMGIAMDDAFVMINSYAMTYYMEAYDPKVKEEKNREDLISLAKHRCSLALSESSLAITLTTLTNLVSFSVGAISPYTAARNFCIICVFGLLGGYIGAFFFFWPVVCLMAKYEHLKPPPPLKLERLLHRIGIRTDCPRPLQNGQAVDFHDYDAKKVVAVNAMVTKRHYRVIRLTNELTRLELYNASVNIANQFKSIWKSAPQGERHTEIEVPEPDTAPLSPVFGHSTPVTEPHEACDLPSVVVLPHPGEYDGNISPRVCWNPPTALESPLWDEAGDAGDDLRWSEDWRDRLVALGQCAKSDYNAVKPPQGTLSRSIRSGIVRFVMTLMRRSSYRWLVVMTFSALLAWLGYQISVNFSKGLEQLYLVPPESYLNDSYAMSAANEIYLIEGQMAFFVQPGHRFSDNDVNDRYRQMTSAVKQQEYIAQTLDPIQIFEQWLGSQTGRVWLRLDVADDPPPFDGSFSEEDAEYETALLYWNLQTGAGQQMNKYLVWNAVPDESDSQIQDDIPWLNPAKSHLEAVMVIYFNDFYPDVSVQSKHFKSFRKLSTEFNKSFGDRLQVYEYNSLHPFFESDDIILRQTLSSMGGALIGIGVVTSLLMDSDNLLHPNSLLVVGMIVLMDVTVFGSMALFGIKLNIITMILLVMSIGFSVDYSLHTAHQYCHMTGNLLERLAMTMIYIGLPLFQGLVSTILASLPLLTRLDEYIYATFFKMVIIVLIVGFIYGVVLLPQVLVIIDKIKGHQEAEGLKVFVKAYQAELRQRHQATVTSESVGLQPK